MPSITILYHFFPPDDVVSSRHFGDFAEELVNRGWKVTVLTSNRYCRYPEKKIREKRENWRGVTVIRTRRLGLNQAGNLCRLINAATLMVGWLFRLLRIPKSDVIVVGTDPQFIAVLFPFLRLLRRGKLLCHWCYDLYPDAIIANSPRNKVLRCVGECARIVMKWAYKSVDLMVDIGPDMRERLQQYRKEACYATLTPWALVEPEQSRKVNFEVRSKLFGEDAVLTLLYSGNLGKAHSFKPFLELARFLRRKNPKIVFCFACRGNRTNEFKYAVTPEDTNIRFAGFADENELHERLTSADIHLLSLRSEWQGIVVPSKFFGSLAVGKPLLFAGPDNSAIARWIREFDVGMILNLENKEEVANILLKYAEDNQQLQAQQEKAFRVYQEKFSKKYIMDQWNQLLRQHIT
jgi:glycosyltransferase involved in cell wall biosynthesis